MTTPDRPIRDCQCPNANHQHGTAAAYRTDGCRCAPCSAAQAEDVRAYRLQRVTGRNNYRAEATRVRNHVAVLRGTWGLSPNAIAAAAGVSYQTIYRLDTAERITRRAGAALLRVTLDDMPDDALVNARGVHRRVQALATLGYAPRWVASQIRYGNPTHILTVNRCRLGTHRAVDAIYEDLWDTPRPVKSLDDMRARQRVVNRARREGWLPPAMWDDIDLDPWPVDDQDAHEVLLCLRDGLDAQETAEALGYTAPMALQSHLNHKAYRYADAYSVTARMAYRELSRLMREEARAA